MYKKIKNIWQTLYKGIMCDTRTTTIIVGLLVVLTLLLCGCKTTKTTIVDKSEINDSTSVRTELRQDSSIINQTTEETADKTEVNKEIIDSKTENTEKEITTEDTIIKFGDGGGTYNTLTGESTNVSSVNISKETDKLKKENQSLRQENKEVKEENSSLHQKNTALISENTVLTDSIAKLNRQMDIESEVEETYQMDWYWWLAIGALLMLIAIVVLRKIPQTRWLLFWI